MPDEQRLIEKLRKIEALFAGATTQGEKSAAGSAAERIRNLLRDAAKADSPIEYRFSVGDDWSRRLLLALLRRYGIQPYRYRSQRRTTIMARVSRGFVDDTLWPEFLQFNRTLRRYLDEMTDRVIREVLESSVEDEEVRADERAMP